MANSFEKSVAAAVLLSVSGFAAGWGCPAVFDAAWESAMLQASNSMGKAIQNMEDKIAASRADNLARLMSGIKVLTEQVNTSSEKKMASDIAAKKSGALYDVALSNRKEIFNTTMSYSAETGQGFQPCDELQRSKDVAVAIGESNHDMQDKVLRELDAAPGRMTSSQLSIVNQRLTDAKTLYCTKEEAAMKLCSEGKLSGKDVDASHFFTTSIQGSDESKAKSALLNNMFGIPHQAIPKNAVNTPQARAFIEVKRNEDAIRSVSQASLKSVQSWTEGKGTASDKSDSVLDALKKKVDTYSGGENYAAWEKSKTSQSERGLLVEYAKMMAAELYMLHSEYQQSERIEMLMATWQALKAREMLSASSDVRVQSAAAKAKVN